MGTFGIAIVTTIIIIIIIMLFQLLLRLFSCCFELQEDMTTGYKISKFGLQ
jgi:hypothetical protein